MNRNKRRTPNVQRPTSNVEAGRRVHLFTGGGLRAAVPCIILWLAFPMFGGDPTTVTGPVPQAPPTPPPTLERPDAPPVSPWRPQGPTLYSIGDPTDQEQYYLELINRARADPSAEGQRLAVPTDPEVLSAYDFFDVNLGLMVTEFDAIPAAPPLSFHPALIQAARLHSGDMFTNQYQGHTNSAGLGLSTRISNEGYTWSTVGENVFSYARSVFHGHAGFEVDWGAGTGGMQDPRGHRNSIHSSAFREIGIGVVLGVNGSVGPQLVTQDFASRNGITPFVTGVAYYDLNTNSFYDLGEGIGGLLVDVTGSQFHALTATSGGYSVPVPANGDYTVTFSGTNLADEVRAITVVNGASLKVDFTPIYAPPVISGPGTLAVGAPGTYTFSTVGGADRYNWMRSALVPYTAVEGAENGTGNFLVDTSEGYSVTDSQVKASGSFSFHLAMPDFEDQSLELNRDLRAGTAAQLDFASRLGWATPGQVAEAQVSLDGGGSWLTVWSRAGTGDAGQSSFASINVPLTTYAGQSFRVRFRYHHASGSIFGQTDAGVGWYIDNVRFSDVEEQSSTITNLVTSPAFSFSAPAEGRHQLRVQPQIAGRSFPAGPEKIVEVSGTAPPSVEVASVVLAGPAQLEIECTVQNGPPSNIQLETRADLASAWTIMTQIQAQEITPGTQYRFDVPIGTDPQAFYRVRIDP